LAPEPDGAAPLGTLRAGFERTGTPAWVMRVIRQQGFDRAAGFRLDLELTGEVYQGRRQATVGDLLSGALDLIDTDWLSLGRLRAEGATVVGFHPYGRIMGGLVVDRDQLPDGLADLAGQRLAVVNRLDKTWLVLRAQAMASGLGDPTGRVDLVETGSKAEALRLLRSGAVGGAVLYWHLAAVAALEPRLRLAWDALPALETLAGAPLPTTFFVAADGLRQERPELLRAFARAFDAAAAAMRADAALWRAGAAESAADDTAGALRAAWLRRIGLDWPARLPARLTACFDTLKSRVGSTALGLDRLPAGTLDPEFLGSLELTV
jgi:NitT/TauT family transport system substrate-binding protein